jgi:hypothetical protein
MNFFGDAGMIVDTGRGGYAMDSRIDPRIRFRLRVDGKVVDETWIDAGNPDCVQHANRLAIRHNVLAIEAERAGRRWEVETYDPALPDGANTFRFDGWR